jgi:hypothetical protein
VKLLLSCDNFETQQYAIIAERFRMQPEFLQKIFRYWMQEKPLCYIRWFRDKKLLRLVQSLRNIGVKIVVYSDYPVKSKIVALKQLQTDHLIGIVTCIHSAKIKIITITSGETNENICHRRRRLYRQPCYQGAGKRRS